jgi:hypothetical protein
LPCARVLLFIYLCPFRAEGLKPWLDKASYDKTARLWDAATGKPIELISQKDDRLVNHSSPMTNGMPAWHVLGSDGGSTSLFSVSV